ncbi:MAG: helix-turn-helix domain-containing protein [Deltaproteobacteria bacterium]|nr:helix-turn-helix domain-containing protein [Deltaproteobacteria bacterium]
MPMPPPAAAPTAFGLPQPHPMHAPTQPLPIQPMPVAHDAAFASTMMAPPGASGGIGPGTVVMGGSLPSEMEALERQRILDALARCGGNQTQAAEMLGISRRTLLRRLDEYAVPRPRK